jgi:hypothetical protein
MSTEMVGVRGGAVVEELALGVVDEVQDAASRINPVARAKVAMRRRVTIAKKLVKGSFAYEMPLGPVGAQESGSVRDAASVPVFMV